MKKILAKFYFFQKVAFIKNESGATSIEYAVIAAGIAAIIVATVYSIGASVSGMFIAMNTAL